MTKNVKRVSLASRGANRPQSSSVAEPQDPITRMAMKVSVLDIEPYHKNPRHTENEKYAEIKASIKANGLEQPFTITRRPGDPKYTVRAGGNTRVSVLRELYTETKDPKFLTVDVFFEPYTQEKDLLISHLVENDLRGNLTLLDRARGVCEARVLFETELGRGMGSRELSEALKENGYTLGRTVINVLTYAWERLYPVIPELLENGAGKPVIERIRKSENQLRRVWKALEEKEANIEKSFKWVFEESLKEALKFSDSGIESDELFRAFEVEAALVTGLDINIVRIAIAEMDTTKVVEEKAREPDEVKLNQAQTTEKITTLPEKELEESEEEISQKATNKENNSTPKNESESPLENLSDDLLGSSHQEQEVEFKLEPYVDGSTDEDDLELLRETIFKQALIVAEEAELSDLVSKIDRGVGFALIDMPQDIHFTASGINDESPAFQKIWQIWYQLYLVCGATLPLEITNYDALISYDNDLKSLIEQRFDDITDLGQYVTTTALTFNLQTESSDHVFRKIERLIQLVRHINQSASKQNINLWERSNDL